MKNLSILSFGLASLTCLIFSCSVADQAEDLSVRKGEINVAADESFLPIAQAQIDAYQMSYPEAKINLIITPEQKAINLMLNDSVDLAIVARELNDDEQKYFTAKNIEYQPGRMALDAIALIVNKNYPSDSISLTAIEGILNDTDGLKTKLLFDNSNSSSLNYMIDQFKIDSLKTSRIFAGKGTLDVFDIVQERNNTIGLVGMNWISDNESKDAQKLKESVKILKVYGDDGIAYEPSLYNVKTQQYPFVKTIYLHTTQDRWGVAKGFVRYACSQLGQLVVEKMDLQPYYLIPKRYSMSSTPDIVTVE